MRRQETPCFSECGPGPAGWALLESMLEMQGLRPCPKPTAPASEFQQDRQLPPLPPPWGCPLLPPTIRPSPGVVSCPGSQSSSHTLVHFIPYVTKLFLARSLGPEIAQTPSYKHTQTYSHAHVDSGYPHTHTHIPSLTSYMHLQLYLAGLFVCLLLRSATVVPALGGTFASMSLTICFPSTQHRVWHDTETQQMLVSEEERERTQVQGKGAGYRGKRLQMRRGWSLG